MEAFGSFVLDIYIPAAEFEVSMAKMGQSLKFITICIATLQFPGNEKV